MQLWSCHFNSTRGEAWQGHVIANSEVALAYQITVGPLGCGNILYTFSIQL